jgi:hypothetical protein
VSYFHPTRVACEAGAGGGVVPVVRRVSSPVVRWVSFPSFVKCRPRHSSSVVPHRSSGVVPIVRRVSSPIIRRRSTRGPPHEQLLMRLGAGWCIVVCRPSLSSPVVCRSLVVCRLSSPRSFVVFVVIRPWCTHNPPDEQLLVSVGVGALSIVVVIHVIVVPRCCRSLLSFVVIIRCRRSLSLSSMSLSSPVLIVRPRPCPRPRLCPRPCLRHSSSSFVVLVPVLVPILVIVPPAVHPTSSCS